jgi:hypothetical protein
MKLTTVLKCSKLHYRKYTHKNIATLSSKNISNNDMNVNVSFTLVYL